MSLTRRQFVSSTAAASAALSLAPAIHGAQKAPTYRTALIGSGWWGMNILKEALAAGNTQAVALCDVDANALDLAAGEVESLTNQRPATYGDFRELLDQEELDVVIIATPDHWHALNALQAIEAGCHVFIEKPTGHTVQESRAILRAARAAERVVQVGLHRRIGPHYREGMQFLKSGQVGEIGMVRMFVHGGGGAETAAPNGEVPEGLDWDMYCGPAPLRPFNRKIHPGGFRNFLDFANGTLGDWGVHWLDQLLMWTDEKYPRHVFSTGGRPIKGPAVLNDREQTTDAPDSQVAVYRFEGFTATWEHRRFARNEAEKHSIGCYFYGSKGTFHMGWRDGWTFYPANTKQQVVHRPAQHKEPDGHSIDLLWNDFTEAIAHKKRPTCDIEVGHLSTNLSLLGMVSYKLGRGITWDGKTERCVQDEEANQLLKRTYRGDWTYPDA